MCVLLFYSRIYILFSWISMDHRSRVVYNKFDRKVCTVRGVESLESSTYVRFTRSAFRCPMTCAIPRR